LGEDTAANGGSQELLKSNGMQTQMTGVSGRRNEA